MKFPEHFALLLLDELVDVLRWDNGSELHGMTWARVAASTARQGGDRIFAAWQRGLRKAHREDPDSVYDEALAVLTAAGLIRHDEGGLLVHAAAARYAPRPELIRAEGPSGERSLFEEDNA